MQGMTEAHNKVRAEVGVKGLAWSDDLTTYAQEWADHLALEQGCRMQHRSHQADIGDDYGENLYWASARRLSDGTVEFQKITPENVVRSWAQEVADYSSEENSCRTGKVCGHYTQIVWEKTVQVGCGRAVCSDKSQIWVCNYDPPGNVVGQRPY